MVGRILLVLSIMWLHCSVFILLFNQLIHAYNVLEAQLYEDLLYDYNKIPRPVKNSSEVLLVDVGSSLIRIIDVASLKAIQYKNEF